MTELAFHAIADIFPLMDGQPLADLTDDIKTHGLREPIWLYEGQILDGRNRWRACQAAGVDPVFVDFNGDYDQAYRFSISLNLHRRHLTDDQRKTFAADDSNINRGELNQYTEKENYGCSNRSIQNNQKTTRADAAELWKVPVRGIEEAKRIKKTVEPDIYNLVKSGDLKLAEARRIGQSLSTEQQLAILKKADPKAVQQAAKELNQKQRALKAEKLKQEKQRQAEQVKQSPNAPRVYCQDAIEFLKQQSGYDLLLTDPPYSTDVDDIAVFASSWLPIALSKLKATGRAYVFIGAYPKELQAYLNVAIPTQVLVWTYRNTLGPAPKGRYKQNWQAILYYCGISALPLNCPELNELFSVHDISAPDARHFNQEHTWQKPDDIADRFVRHASKPGDTVIDPFCCTGTFLLSASRYGRQAFGCDNNEDNLQIALDRGCVCEFLH